MVSLVNGSYKIIELFGLIMDYVLEMLNIL